jgi:hypothetical protein
MVTRHADKAFGGAGRARGRFTAKVAKIAKIAKRDWG